MLIHKKIKTYLITTRFPVNKINKKMTNQVSKTINQQTRKKLYGF
jgi:hypothetical protein